MKPPVLPYSNQFPIAPKVKPASFTLVYDKTNIQDAMNCKWIICKTKQDALVKAGTHKDHLFRIVPNY